MKDGERPDRLPAPLTVAVALRGSHSGVACEVVAHKVTLLEPASDPLRLIACGSGVFLHRFPGHSGESVVVELEKLCHLLGVVRVYVSGEVVVNPSSVAADFIAEPRVFVDELLAEGVLKDVEAFVVAKGIGIWTGGDIDRIGPLF